MITVHHLENSRSQRVLWMLEELSVPYEARRWQRGPDMMAPPELRRIHPLGKSPVLVDGELTLAETGLILTYLCERYGTGTLAPPGADALAPERLAWLYWLHYAEGSAMPPLLIRMIFGMLPKRSPLPLRPFAKLLSAGINRRLLGPQLAMHFDFWEAALRDTGWFAGSDFTAADAMMSFPIEAAASRVGFGPDQPALTDFLARIHARPAYRRALERGGPYSLA